MTLYQEYFGKKPNLVTLHLFGCKAYVHTPKVDQTKFGECTIECVHIRFAQEKKAYLLYNREHCQLIESCDVEFKEIDAQEHVTVELDSDNSGDPEGGQRQVDHQESPRVSGNNNGDVTNTPVESSAPTSSILAPLIIHRSARMTKGILCIHTDKDPKLELSSRPTAKKDSVGTKGRTTHEGNQTTHTDDNDEDASVAFLTADTPQSYQEAIRWSDAEEWVEAIAEECNNLEWKRVFVEVECPPNACIHEGQLVFSEKVGPDGDITRKKVRLVTKGYMEVWGEDYWHTYSPTLGCNTLFLCLAYAATLDLEIHQMDAVAAYLNSDLTEEIYLQPPEGVPVSPNTIWHLKKALYGLKQAGLEWYWTLWKHLKLIGYAQSAYDPCLYVQGEEVFVLVYVNDFLVFNSREKIIRAKKKLAGRYEMHDLGEVHWFLTMEITHDWVAQTITIDQRQYIAKIL